MKIKRFLFFVVVVLLAVVVVMASGAVKAMGGSPDNVKEENDEKEVKDAEEIRLVHDYLIPPPPSHVIYDNIKKIMDNEEKKEV